MMFKQLHVNMRISVCILFFAFFAATENSNSQSASAPPKREFRGAWIATVINLDWPTSPRSDPFTQKLQLMTMLDSLKSVGINAVVFQVRCESDALYNSSIDPWSYWLTGEQGRAPNPYYDPLEFAVDQAHRRGMELHAWFNPYRSDREVTGSGSYPKAPNHVTVLHPDWNIQIGNIKFLDPGLPQVRDYITTVVMDIVRRYDVDGVHADDYFYPYPPNQITNQDDSTFIKYPNGFTNRGDWRRYNVNVLIRSIHDSIQIVKPHVKFGMSPFGIWKNGVPSGITGMDAYSTIYCDATAWLSQGWIDYLSPQLYWPIGGSQDYWKLMPWWLSQINGRHLYPGQAPYRLSTWGSSELPNQIRANRSTVGVGGSLFFRANNGILDNLKGFADSLRSNLYQYPSLLPAMSWKDNVTPNPPRNLRYEYIVEAGGAALKWDAPLAASDGDSASRYAIYRFDHSSVLPSELDASKNIVSITGGALHVPKYIPSGSGAYYLVTALDRNYNESGMSNVVFVTAAAAPILASPLSGTPDVADTVVLKWRFSSLASSYRLQVGTDSSFASGIFTDVTLKDTLKLVIGLQGQQVYFWRVNAINAGGASPYSLAWSFRSAVPSTPVLRVHENFAADIPWNPTLRWDRATAVLSYRIQVSKSPSFDPVLADSAGITDTSFALSKLEAFTIYYWRVQARNAYGNSQWSAAFKFRTVLVMSVSATGNLPTAYELSQNYPNPFNPVTTIQFSIPTTAMTTLRVYDLLGREVRVLVQEVLNAGVYKVSFEGSSLTSGTYFYVLTSGQNRIAKKMVLLR